MNSPTRRYLVLLLLAALLSGGLYWYVASSGLAGTADTYSYVSAAYKLQQSGRLLPAAGQAYQWWPPLFILVLRLVGAAEGVRWLNGVCLVGALLAWSTVGYWLLPVRRAWALPLLVALGSPTLVVSKFLWSESLLNVLWASYFLMFLAWLRRGGWRLGLLATILGWLLPLQRIAGAFLLLGVGLGLAWPGTPRLAQPNRRAQMIHFAGVSSGLVLWQLHQSMLGNTLALPQDPYQAVASFGFVMGRWLVPLPAVWLISVPSFCWILLLMGVVRLLWPQQTGRLASIGGWSASWSLLGARLLFGALVSTLILLIGSVLTGRAGAGVHEAERFITALYPPVVLLVLLIWRSQYRWLGSSLLTAWLLYQAVRLGHNVQYLRHVRPIELNYPHPRAFWEQAAKAATRVRPSYRGTPPAVPQWSGAAADAGAAAPARPAVPMQTAEPATPGAAP